MTIVRYLTPVLMATLVGCTSDTHVSDQTQAAVKATADDALLNATVRAKLVTVDVDSVPTLGVKVHDGVVTLSGRVRSAAAKERVLAAAHTTDAKSVRDEVTIDASIPPAGEAANDAALAARASAALFTQVGLNQIHIAVKRRVATVSGQAADQHIKDAALAAARNTSGITSVVDRVQ